MSTTTPPSQTPESKPVETAPAAGATAPASVATPATSAPTGASRPMGAGARPGYRPGGSGRPSYGSRPGGGDGRPGGRPGYGNRPGGRGMMRRKVCRFCAEHVFEVDYKAIHVLRSFMTARGKLLSGRTTGNCAKHQRQVEASIKRAQNIALLPTTGE